MTSDQVSTEIKRAYPFYPAFWDRTGWGYGVSTCTAAPATPDLGVGSYGWAGGFNTHWRTDPANDLVALLFTQRLAGGPADEEMISTFWRGTAEALLP
jgi:CubicO group peptidase (beta-lactamase class C family)